VDSLHDLGFDTERISVEQYSALLTKITEQLAAVQKQSGAKLLWVKTTPVPTVPMYGPGCNDTRSWCAASILSAASSSLSPWASSWPPSAGGWLSCVTRTALAVPTASTRPASTPTSSSTTQ